MPPTTGPTTDFESGLVFSSVIPVRSVPVPLLLLLFPLPPVAGGLVVPPPPPPLCPGLGLFTGLLDVEVLVLGSSEVGPGWGSSVGSGFGDGVVG